MAAMRRYAAMWKGGLGAGAPEWLADHGWRTRTHEMAAVAAAYGRAGSEMDGGFLTASRNC
jgi:O-methyltransferase involved in polyketide biosynthesis